MFMWRIPAIALISSAAVVFMVMTGCGVRKGTGAAVRVQEPAAEEEPAGAAEKKVKEVMVPDIPDEVKQATRLREIVFFREDVEKRPGVFFRGTVRRGNVDGTFRDSARLVSKAAAKDGQLGLHLEVVTQGEDTAWRLEIMPEKKDSHYPRHAPPYFDVYAYRPHGTLEFDLRGEAKGKGLGVAFRHRRPVPKPTLLDNYLKQTADWQHVVVPVKDLDLSTIKAELMMADWLVISGEGGPGNLSIDLDNIVLRSDGPESERGPVRVDHVGYLPDRKKVGFVGGSRLFGLSGRPFQVREAGSDGEPIGRPVFEGKLALKGTFEPVLYGEYLYSADFSSVKEQGRYVLEVPGVGTSVPFYIHEALHDYLYYHTTRFFLYQRNGCALPPENAFEWSRGEIYTQPIPFLSDPARTKIVRHGWFDAGDSRIFPQTDRVGTLLLGWELSKENHFDGQLNIPESGNGVPDILDEIRHHVEFYREVQLEDGRCPGWIMTGKGGGNPTNCWGKGYENDTDPRYIHDTKKSRSGFVTTQACACFAMLARCLEPYDPDGAKLYETAALKAWAWLDASEPIPSLSPRGRADRLWAAVELWRLTGEKTFHTAVRTLVGMGIDEEAENWDSAGWRDGAVAWNAWVSYSLDLMADDELKASFLRRYLNRIDTMFDVAARDPYGAVIYDHEFYFSFAGMARASGLLAIAWKLTGEEKYRALAEDHLHFVCGRNVHRLCMVSNVAPETHDQPFHMLEWLPNRKAWMPGYVQFGAVNSAGTLSRFRARRFRVTRRNYWFSEPCVGFNRSLAIATMILMQGKKYPDLIQQGAIPGVKPFRPGLPFPPTVNIPWGAEPVVPKQP